MGDGHARDHRPRQTLRAGRRPRRRHVHRRARAGSSGSSGPTAPARPRPCAASSGSPDPIAARSAGRARSSTARRVCASATCPSSAGCIRGCASPSSSATSPSSTACRGKAANAASSRWLERMGLADRAKSKLEELSHGNQQRIQLATALVHDPELLVLDEPFSRPRPDRHRDDDRGHPRASGGRRRGRLLEPSARPRRGRLRGRRDHRPRPDRRRRRDRGAQGRSRAASISRSRSSAPGRRLARRRAPALTVLERDGDRVKLLVDRAVDLDALLPGRRRPARSGRSPTSRRSCPSCSWRPSATAMRPAREVALMPRWRSIWLVARREILERGRSRGFILSVLFTTLIVVGSFVVPALFFGDDADAPRSASSSRRRRPCPAAIRRRRDAVRPEGRDHDVP